MALTPADLAFTRRMEEMAVPACPFCGDRSQVTVSRIAPDACQIACLVCGGAGPSAENAEDAFRLWAVRIQS